MSEHKNNNSSIGFGQLVEYTAEFDWSKFGHLAVEGAYEAMI